MVLQEAQNRLGMSFLFHNSAVKQLQCAEPLQGILHFRNRLLSSDNSEKEGDLLSVCSAEPPNLIPSMDTAHRSLSTWSLC